MSKYKNSYFIPEVRVYGPYLIRTGRAKGRNQVLLYYPCGRRRTIMYAKFLMENSLKRELGPEETVDHKDNNKLNDVLENLQILSRADNAKKDAKRVEPVEITCIRCNKKALRSGRDINHNAKMGKAGPFCSKKCLGTYGAEVQNKKTEKLPAQKRCPISERTYYTNNKSK